MSSSAPRLLVPSELVEKFRALLPAHVGDVLRGLGLNCIAEGVYPLDRKMKVCGTAVTMRHIASRDGKNRARHEQVLIEMCRPGDVLVVDMGGRTDGGTWGGGIAVDAQKRGLDGVVIDGGARESEELIRLGFPTFVRGVTQRHTHGSFVSTCLNNEPVQIGVLPFAVPIYPGDLVLGDADGIVVVPREMAQEVYELAKERTDIDRELDVLFRAGKGHGDRQVDALIARIRELEHVEQVEGYKW